MIGQRFGSRRQWRSIQDINMQIVLIKFKVKKKLRFEKPKSLNPISFHKGIFGHKI
jgi:hypothetical protein